LFRQYQDFWKKADEENAAGRSATPLTPEENNKAVETINKVGIAGVLVQLDIESFYLFAPILMNRVEHTIQQYFGKEESHPLFNKRNGGSQFVEKFVEYCIAKSLTGYDELLSLAKKLRSTFTKCRNEQITHLKNPYGMPGVGNGIVTYMTPINPIQNDLVPNGYIQTQPLLEILNELDVYITSFVTFLTANKEKREVIHS
jgi:hypothetical protein